MAIYPGMNKVRLLGRVKGFDMFSQPKSMIQIMDHPLYKEADIIHFHWISHFVDWKGFFMNNKKPLVWTLHDMNPFTGGCHYSMGCEKFQNECKNCPQLKGTLDRNYSFKNLNYKRKYLNKTAKLIIVTPSNWLRVLSSSSNLFKDYEHITIRNGVDTENWKPIKKDKARGYFNLPNNKTILLFVADKLRNRRKGFKALINALEKIYSNDNSLLLCSVGKQIEKTQKMDFEYRNLGFIVDEKEMNKVYAASDCLIIPSVEDNLPNTIIESLLSGTPVIGFPNGGIPEMIEHGKNGLICKNSDVDSLTEAIETFIKDKFNFSSNDISKNASMKYNIHIQAQKYIYLYNEILNNR